MSDLRDAIRTIAGRRWSSAVIVATLALGIGINTTVYSLADTLLFKPPPFPHGERIVAVTTAASTRMSFEELLDLRASTSAFERLEAWRSNRTAVLGDSEVAAEPLQLARVTPGWFTLVGASPLLGRVLAPDDERADAPVALVIGFGVWQTRYQGAADVIGRAVRLGEESATIVGVMSRGFALPETEQAWIAYRPSVSAGDPRDNRELDVLGLLKRGQTMTSAPGSTGVRVMTFNDRYAAGKIRTLFPLMLAAVGLVLMVACANVANMMLGAALERQREISIRAALGASRGRIVRQVLVESVVLSVLGGLAGLGVTILGVRAFEAAMASGVPDRPAWLVFDVNYRVLGYLAALSVGTGILFGLAPALRSLRTDLNEALKSGGRGVSAGSPWVSGTLVVLQFAMTVVLLAGAGLMVRSIIAGTSINPWMPTEQILRANASLPVSRYPDREARLRFFEELLPHLASLPGVTHAGVMGQSGPWRYFEIDGRSRAPADLPNTPALFVSESYFSMVNLPIMRGHVFGSSEGRPGQEVAVISQAFVARHWPNEDPLGKQLRFMDGGASGPWMTVVGVCGDLVLEGETGVYPVLFAPWRQGPVGNGVRLALRSSGDVAALTNPLRAAAHAAEADVVLSNVSTMASQAAVRLWPYRIFGTLFLVFAASALLMAAVGLYAVVAQATTRRGREIAIRLALGATPMGVLRTVMRRGVMQLGIGLATGLAAALLVTGTIRSLLLGVEPTDPITFAVVGVVLSSVGLFACWLPARRVAATSPARVLARAGD